MTLWALLRVAFARELRAHERFVQQLEVDPQLSNKQRRRRLHGAIRERDRARAKLRLVELFAVHRVPVPARLGKQVALAKHFDRSAREATRSRDRRSAHDWSTRCRATLRDAWELWSAWNSHAKKPACAGSVDSRPKVDTLQGVRVA